MPGIFDIIGPVMVGPSSSHTAGAVRLGLFARRLHGAGPARVEIGLHGSFAATGDGHGTPLALLAGVMGLAPDDGRIPQAKELASQHGLSYAFSAVDLGEVHPNSVRIRLSSATGLPDERTEICGSSTGGGEIQIWRIDDFRVDFARRIPHASHVIPRSSRRRGGRLLRAGPTRTEYRWYEGPSHGQGRPGAHDD